MSRAEAVAAFLADAGLGRTPRRPLAGDASARRYERVGGLVLMDADPATGQDVAPFLLVRDRLDAAGLSVPALHAADRAAGLLLMEDLGDAVLAREAAAGGEARLYAAAAETMAAMRAVPTDGLPDHAAALADNVGVAVDWYAPEAAGRRGALIQAVAAATGALPPGRGFVHRDYHAENLVWLPGRAGAARVGILDFQDAGAGPLDYDLASLVGDARRDVGAAAVDAAFAHAAMGRDADDVRRGAAICGAQRSLRILGVFARLAVRDGKPGYLRWLPRVWRQLQDDLRHPALDDLARAVRDILPAPTPDRLAALGARATETAP